MGCPSMGCVWGPHCGLSVHGLRVGPTLWVVRPWSWMMLFTCVLALAVTPRMASKRVFALRFLAPARVFSAPVRVRSWRRTGWCTTSSASPHIVSKWRCLKRWTTLST